MFNRYGDTSKLITDIKKLKRTSDDLVYISEESDYDIAVDLASCYTDFEELKPFIAIIAEHISELDGTVQRFDIQNEGTPYLDEPPYYLYLISVEAPNYVTLEYICTDVNSQFNTIFEYKNGKFNLRQFGTVKNIADDWDKITK